MRNTQLDGLRGCAAIAVVIFHSILDRDPTLNERIVRPTLQSVHSLYDVLTKFVFMLVSGETAVVLFFVLSGAVLFESLRQRHAGPAATALGFSLRRIVRLYPVFFICLTGCLGAFAITGALSAEARHFWPNAALADFSLIGASWTLQVEFLAIPFILVAFWCDRRFGVRGVMATLALFLLVLCEPWLRAHFVTYKRFLPCFALGLVIPTHVGETIARRLPAKIWPVVLGAMLAARHLLGLHWWTMSIVQVIAAVLVALLYYKKAGALGRFFDRGFPQYLGRLSYSLYLCNIIYLILVAHWSGRFGVLRERPLESGVLLAVPVIAASIITAHVLEHRIERPWIALGRRLTQFSVRPAPASARVAALP